ncbi:MAG: ABC-three component system protein, partial [Candidatus Dormibacteria bacterium]
MLHRIFSNDPRFKEVELTRGLNVIVADRTAHSTTQQTRNGAGKSSMIHLIHFLLGDQSDPKSPFRSEALLGSQFGMEFDLGSHLVTVRRSGEEFGKQLVSGYPTEESISLATWKSILASEMFKLGSREGKWAPGMRALLAYFVRRQDAGGFHNAFQNSNKQQLWDSQVCVSWLLGLDWHISQEWQDIRDVEGSLKAVRRAARDGVLVDAIGDAADLRTSLAVEEGRARAARQAAREFRVIDRYRELEAEANETTKLLQDLTDQIALDQQMLDDLQVVIKQEKAPDPGLLREVYRQAGVQLPDAAVRRYEDVEHFHESVITNRTHYLADEVEAVQERVARQGRERQAADQRLSETMQKLHAGGALDQFAGLQAEIGRLEGQVAELRKRFDAATSIETGLAEKAAERNQLLVRLQHDLRDREAILLHEISTFEGLSRELYEAKAGSLRVGAGNNGPTFEVVIPSSRSRGINNMKIWCFDMMNAILCSERGAGPGFVIHDSHLFDGVDERQIAGALTAGGRLANQYGFQYVVTLNTDAVPRDFPEGFDFGSFVRPPSL